MSTQPPQMPPGWYPAQHAQGQLRYWDGARWLESSPEAAVRSKNPLGIVALVIAIVGAVFACVPGALIVGWVLLPTAFVLGIVAVALPRRPRGAAIASIIVAVVGTVVGFVVFLAVVGSAFSNATGGGRASPAAGPVPRARRQPTVVLRSPPLFLTDSRTLARVSLFVSWMTCRAGSTRVVLR